MRLQNDMKIILIKHNGGEHLLMTIGIYQSLRQTEEDSDNETFVIYSEPPQCKLISNII